MIMSVLPGSLKRVQAVIMSVLPGSLKRVQAVVVSVLPGSLKRVPNGDPVIKLRSFPKQLLANQLKNIITTNWMWVGGFIALECCIGLTQYNILKQQVHKTNNRSFSVYYSYKAVRRNRTDLDAVARAVIHAWRMPLRKTRGFLRVMAKYMIVSVPQQ